MTSHVYREAFERAKADLADAMGRRERAQHEANVAFAQSVQLRRTVVALAALCGEDIEDSMGLTEAVRTIFKAFGTTWLSVKELKANVESIGVILTDLKNPDASVMSVLNRLTTSGELEAAHRKEKLQSGQVAQVKIWRAVQPDGPMEPIVDDDIPF